VYCPILTTNQNLDPANTILGLHKDCPLEEWQEPATNKESLTVEPAAPTKEDICTMLCPSCRTLIHVESCSIINEKDAEIARLKDITADMEDRLSTQYQSIANYQDRIAQQDQEVKDLGEALRKARSDALETVKTELKRIGFTNVDEFFKGLQKIQEELADIKKRKT
jgi:septal ring factor EnvC (AmiA/AmiB activator)